MHKYPVVIIGAGVAGLTAKKYLDANGIECIILEQGQAVGGHAQSHEFDDYIFDEGPHILFSEDEEILEFIGAPSPTTYQEIAKPRNIWRGKYLNHPAYLDLEGLGDKEVAVEIAASLLGAEIQRASLAETYGDWLNATQGGFVRQQFTEIYTRKYWRCSTHELDVDWLGGRIHAPTVAQREVLASLADGLNGHSKLPNLTENSHYLTRFTYHSGGFWSLFPGLHRVPAILGQHVESVDLSAKVVRTTDKSYSYDFLLNTSPLDKFVLKASLYRETPPQLRVTSFLEVNLLVKGGHQGSDLPQWVYIYDETSPISRVSFPDSFNTSTPLPGTIRVQCEIYWDKNLEIEPATDAQEIFKYLVREGLLPEASELVKHQIHRREYGNIVPLVGRQAKVETIVSELKNKDVFLAGRYGRWQYLWTVEAARDGFDAAKRIELEFTRRNS